VAEIVKFGSIVPGKKNAWFVATVDEDGCPWAVSTGGLQQETEEASLQTKSPVWLLHVQVSSLLSNPIGISDLSPQNSESQVR
jgi:hypothetical protein